MKYTALILIITGLFLCDTETYCKRCIEKIPSEFKFLKTYVVGGDRKQKEEYSYVFLSGTIYNIGICSDSTVSFAMYDAQRHAVLKSDPSHGVEQYQYKCAATGVYYLQFQVSEQSRCAGSVLSFKR